MHDNQRKTELGENWPFGNIVPVSYPLFKEDLDTIPRALLDATPFAFRLANWDGDLESRRINIQADGMTIECFGKPSETKRLFVFLNSGKNRVGDVATRFERVGWHNWLDGVCINIEDSTRKWLSPIVSASWYFGTLEKHALPFVAEIVMKVQAYYNVSREDVYFIGSSAGGYAALWLADALVGATAFAGNPQFYVLNSPPSKRFAKAGIDLRALEFADRISLNHLVHNKQSRFFTTINARSKIDYLGQLRPLLREWSLPRLRYGLNSFGNFSFYCRSFYSRGAVSPHHALDDLHEFRMLFGVINLDAPIRLKADMLNTLHEMQATRLTLADKVFFENRWAEFLRNSDLPLTIPRRYLSTFRARFLLKGCDPVFYQVSWGELGRHAYISLMTKREANELAPIFKELALACGGVYENKNGKQVLKLGRFRHVRARKVFGNFVHQTSVALYKSMKLPYPQYENEPAKY